MYAEGGDLGYSNQTNGLWPYFGTSYLGDGNASGNVSTLSGQPGTFAAGMSFSYPYQQGPDYWVDIFGVTTGVLLFSDQSSSGRVVINEGSGYRTVCSSVIFGAFRGAQRDTLMSRYMQYLTFLSGTAAAPARPASPVLLRVGPNPVRCGQTVRVSSGNLTAGLSVIDAAGRTIAEPQPDPSGQSTWDLRDRQGRPVPPGSYLLRATGSYGARTATLVVTR